MMPNSMSGVWEHIPDDITLHVFTFLPAGVLLKAAQVCKCWHRVSRDELLWKDLFYRHWKIDRNIAMAPGRTSWLQEYKRLYYHTPAVDSEVIRQHADQVLHVSFSNNGKLFASCSKDGFIKVWNTTYPVSLKYKENMKRYTWKYTQFSQFNETDTLLLVSGVHFGSNSTSGEIAVFSLQGNFELQARVINKPYDVFGTWYNDTHLISGTLHWTGQLQSCSVLWLNKANQETESEHEAVVMRLYKLRNVNASSIRTVMVANCREVLECDDFTKGSKRVQMGVEKNKDGSSSKYVKKSGNQKLLGTIEYNQEYRDAEKSPTVSANRGKTDCHNHPSFDEEHCVNCDMSNKMSKSRTPRSLVIYSSEEDDDDIAADRLSKRSLSDVSLPDVNTLEDIVLRERNNSGMSIPDEDNLVEITTKCVSLTSETDTLPVNAKTDSLNIASGTTSDASNVNNSSTDCTHSSHCAASCSCRNGMYLDGAVYGSPIQSNFFSSYDHKVALDEWNPESALHMGDPSIIFPSFSNAEPRSANTSESTKILDKFLIFTQGSQTYTPHQIGIKRIRPLEKIPGDDDRTRVMPDLDLNMHGLADVEYDTIDKVIDMHGHIIGLALSPDQRYLYVNCRPWPKDYDIQNPLAPPPIAQEIDIHVIDLLRLTEVGTMYRAHKAYTPNDECFFIFLDVSQQYVASGAEDKHGYIWDRHYGVCLNKFQHTDVVNCVAFNPKDSEMLITVSDDCTIKIWRSLNKEKNMKFTGLFNPGLYS